MSDRRAPSSRQRRKRPKRDMSEMGEPDWSVWLPSIARKVTALVLLRVPKGERKRQRDVARTGSVQSA